MKHTYLLFCFLVFFGLPSLAQPTLVFPNNNMNVYQSPVNFSWNLFPDAITYQLQISTSSTFATTVVNQNNIAATTASINSLSFGTIYFWRVRANTIGGPSAWSQVYTLYMFLPTSYPNLSLWLRGDGPIVKDVANRVSQWTDGSGSLNNVSQTDQPSQPLLVNSVTQLNSLSTLRFDGVNDFLLGSDFLDIGTNSRTMFTMGLSNSSSTSSFYAKAFFGIEQHRYALFWDGTFISFLVDNGTIRNISGALSTGVYRVHTVTINRTTGTHNLSLNGTSQFTLSGVSNSSVNIGNNYPFIVGSYNNGPGNGGNGLSSNNDYCLSGDIAEMVFYDAALDTTQRRNIDRYLMDKYSPPVNLGQDINKEYGFCSDTLRARSGFTSYTWSNGATGEFIVVNQSGTYSITCEDIFGRTSKDTILVNRIEPNYTGITSICAGSSRIWDTGLVSNDYNFSWSPSGNTAALTISNPGNYRVTVTDTSVCQYISPIVNFSLDSYGNTIEIANSSSIDLCSGNFLGLLSGGAGAVSYNWNDGTSLSTLQVFSSGSYHVTVSNANGCLGIDTVQVNIVGVGPVANFSADPVCDGLPVEFNDLSTVQNPFFVTDWKWYFGDGDSSDLQNPNHTYNSAGTYSATLIAFTTGCNSSPITKQVTVYDSVVAFFVDSLACINTPALFSDRSLTFSGDVVTDWFWEFGGGNVATDDVVSYAFLSPGNYQVTLTVTTDLGCTDNYINDVSVVSTAPLPGSFNLLTPLDAFNFTASPITFSWDPSLNALSYQLQISFDSTFNNILVQENSILPGVTITSLTPSNLPYYWRVLARNICNEATYSEVREFTYFIPSVLGNCLQLWLDANGSKQLDANNFVTQWTDQSGKGNNCSQTDPNSRPRFFSNVLNGLPVLRFDGNDFLTAGNKLNIGTNSRTTFVLGKSNLNTGFFLAKTIFALGGERYSMGYNNGELYYQYIEQTGVIKDVNIPNNSFGQFEMLEFVTDRNAQQNRVYENSINLGNTSPISTTYNMSNPQYEFLVGGYNNSVGGGATLNLNGDMAEVLIFDCVLTPQETQNVYKYLQNKYSPPVYLGADISINYGFCDTVTLNASERFETYNWSTGDTGVFTINVTQSGIYSVTVTDIFGFTSVDSVRVTVPSVIPLQDESFCLGTSLIWDTDLNNPNYDYLWSDNTTSPSLFIDLPGLYSVTITDTTGCQSILSANITVDSFAITTTLGDDTTLCSGQTLGLETNVGQVELYTWSTNETTPIIIVTQPGTYSVTAISDIGCLAIDTIQVGIDGQIANVDFMIQNLCFLDTVQFSNLTSVDPGFTITSTLWDFGDNNTSSLQNTQHRYSSIGTYEVSLTVITDFECVSTISKSLTLLPLPEPVFTYPVQCAGLPILFDEMSTPPSGENIVSYNWYFDTLFTSVLPDPEVIFEEAGSYFVTLEVGATNSCSNTITKEVEIYPALDIEFDADGTCINDATSFTDLTSNFSIVAWEWNMGDGAGFYTIQNPTHLYSEAKSYQVQLTVTNAIGCSDTYTKAVEIFAPPVAAMITPDACPTAPYRFLDASVENAADPIISWQWEFEDGSTSIQPNPPFLFDTAGVFEAYLVVTTLSGCTDEAIGEVIVTSPPTASFGFSPSFGAPPLTVNFDNLSTQATSYFWNFDDGSTSTDEDPQHVFTYPQDFPVVLVVTNSGGCSDTFSAIIPVDTSSLDLAVEEVFVTIVDTAPVKIVRIDAKLTNLGTRDISIHRISAQLDNGNLLTEQWVAPVGGNFPPGQQKFYRFSAFFTTTDLSLSNYLCVQTSYPENIQPDGNPLNDKACLVLGNEIEVSLPYPVPGDDQLNLDIILLESGVFEVTIYDMLGRRLLQDEVIGAVEGLNRYVADISFFAEAAYLIEVKYKGNYIVRKFLVER